MAETAYKPHRWCRAEYERMAEAGVLEPDARIELIDGEILEMAPHGTRHFTAIRLVEESLRTVFGLGYEIRTQGPLALDEGSEPEPDVAVVRGSPRDFRQAHPRTALLIVEVSDTSLGFDRLRKKRVYARNRIPEYWILDLAGERLEVYRAPRDDDYGEKQTLSALEQVIPLAVPDAAVAVSDLLP